MHFEAEQEFRVQLMFDDQEKHFEDCEAEQAWRLVSRTTEQKHMLARR